MLRAWVSQKQEDGGNAMSRTRKSPGSIERRGKGLRVRLCVGGERHYLMLRTTDKRVAKQRGPRQAN